MELFGETTITRKIILEGGLVVVDDGSRSGSGSGVVIGANDTPLTIFETKSHYDYDHAGYTDFSPDFAKSNKCSSCKCQDCKAKYDRVINVINALTASNGLLMGCGDKFHWVLAVIILRERHIRVYDSMLRRRGFRSSFEIQKLAKILPTYLDMSGFLDQKVHTDWSMIEAYWDKMGNPFDVQYVEEIYQQTIGSLDCSPFVAIYAEYLSNEFKEPNDEIDVRLLCKRYSALL
ncbi:hypothetical protein CQW23_26019 [Capsicum baccatum]|uniref:Ubiquitin-like protease family profile domain-containing protein n=1 Tax=Capsicum baccatum TaxID=33114 RepID=A0A2G2VMN6_CAPBA|nr:hypothetical protein CQW23_26019 [Capsicum baccatum]